jgi:hypothetical protein
VDKALMALQILAMAHKEAEPKLVLQQAAQVS